MKTTTYVPVDIYNEFSYNNKSYIINWSVKQYEVHNRPERKEDGSWNDWTNEARMTHVVVKHDDVNFIHFFDENGVNITNDVHQV